MANRLLPAPILWFVVATDMIIAALALGLYFGLVPKFHPALDEIPAATYPLAAALLVVGAGLMLFMQKRLSRRQP